MLDTTQKQSRRPSPEGYEKARGVTMSPSSVFGELSNIKKSICELTAVPEAGASLERYIGFYNTRRPHSPLDGKTSDQAYFNLLRPVAAEA